MRKIVEWFWIHLRWRLYKFAMRWCLGKPCGDWDRVVYTLSAVSNKPTVAKRLSRIIPMSEAHVIRFDYPVDFPPRFIRTKTFAQRCAYELKGVAISVDSGAVWVPDEWAFIESVGALNPLYSWGGCLDFMRRPRTANEDSPIVPCANMPYFHWLLNVIPQVLHADRIADGKIKVAISDHSYRYLCDGLRFFGFSDDRIVITDSPLLVKRSILVPRNAELGLLREEDIAILRENICERVSVPAQRTRRIYISRRLEKGRAIANEADVERLVTSYGFEVRYFETMSFAEQMQTIAEAAVVMGIHGAGLSNIIAGQDGLAVIELFRPDWFVPCFVQLAFQLKFNYHYLLLRDANGQVVAPLPEIERLLNDNLRNA